MHVVHHFLAFAVSVGVRQFPFVSFFTVAFANPERLSPEGARPRESSSNTLDDTTLTDPDGQKWKDAFD
jgi:hypothetical protein